LAESAFYGVGAALGFSLVLIVFAGIRERLQLSDIPQPFQGASIALITAGFMALALMGFTGMIRL
jgi:electron transport complex protein RnfA